MANPCIISYKGADYSYEEWMATLHDGLLDTLVNDGSVNLGGKLVATRTRNKDKAIAALKALKVDNRNKLNFFGLIPEAWNTILDGLALAIEGGAVIADAIADAVVKAKALSKDFDESGFKARMNEIFGGETGSVVDTPAPKVMKLSQRQMASEEIDPELKEGILSLGIEYIPDKISVTNEEAKAYVDAFESVDNLDKAMENVMDMNNDMRGLVRGTIGAVLFDSYSKKARNAQTIAEKRSYESKAATIARFSAALLNQSGKTSAVAGKIWKKMLENTPEGAITALQQQYAEATDPIVDKDIKDIRSAKQILEDALKTEEGKALISEQVDKEIGKQAEKLFGKEQKDKIINFFDSLLIDTKGKVFDATFALPVAIINGAIKAVKNATLLGADAANAIKAGVDYVADNYNKAWKQKEFELMMGQGLKTLKPKRKVKPSQKVQQTILDAWEKRLKRLKPESRKKLLADSIEELNNAGALSEDRFKELYAEAMGLPTVTEEMKIQITNLVDTINKAESARDAYKKAFEDGTPAEKESAKKALGKALREADIANQELSRYFKGSKNVWETLGTILQGNLLTPASLATNVYANMNYQPIRLMIGGVSSLTDYIISKGAEYTILSKVFNKGRTVDIIARMKGANLKGLPMGVVEGLKDVRYGLSSEEVNQRDLSNKLEPIREAARLWATYNGKDNMKAKEQVNAYIEAVFGIPAETYFRLLNLGDKPFRKMAEMGKAYELATLKGLKGKDFEQFIEFPDTESAELIKQAGDEATFQKDNNAQKVVTKMTTLVKQIPLVGQPLGFLLKGIIPYVKTPTNLIGVAFDLGVPPITLARSAYYASKGERARSLEYFGRAVVGSMLSYVAYQLLLKGLLTGSGDDDEPKEKQMQREQVPPNSLNISALRRGMAGRGYEQKNGDTWVNYTKTGLSGTILGMYANIGVGKTKEQILQMPPLEIGAKAGGAILQTSLEQSFLKGTSDLLLAVLKGGNDADRFLTNYTNAISATAYPNTIATFSRTVDDNIRNINDETLGKEIENMFKVKMFQGDELPSKVTLWGEKVKNAPAGRNKYLYNLFDVTKYKNVATDNFGFKIYDAWNKTKDSDFLPSIPQNKFSENGVEVKLTPMQLEAYQILVGQERKALVEIYVNSTDWEEDDNATRIETLKGLYEEGKDNAKYMFIESDPEIYKKVNPED